MIAEGIFIAMTLILVGRIFKSVKMPMSQAEKNARIRIGGQIRRVCSTHQKHLNPGVMAVLDQKNCDYCKMLNKMIEDLKK